VPQSFAQLLVHIIFSTKGRAPLICPDVRPRLYPYLGATLQASGCEPVQIGGTADHVHIAGVSRPFRAGNKRRKKDRMDGASHLGRRGSPTTTARPALPQAIFCHRFAVRRAAIQ
jgi:REP element-mobilizing transposase RayT